ncbi:MAG: efflux RND transporter permease subunit [Candidatus Thermoplasmatota archaeon]|nr:efflux RND transporter permease subunit [Candidatus Thermoplasmatota archaeon]
MGSVKVLDKVAGAVNKNPKMIILVVLLITIAGGIFLRNLSYETDIAAFFPDNETVAANERLEGYFGRDAYMHLILVEGVRGRNVLSPESLREQYRITLAAEEAEGVVGTQSIAVVINELCHYVFNPRTLAYSYNESRNILNTPTSEIQGRINVLQSLIDGEIDPSQFGQGDIDLDPEAVKFSFGLLVSSDFDVDNFTATRALILVELDGNYSRSDLRNVVGGVKSNVNNLELAYVSERETSEYFIAHEMESTIQPTMAVLGIGIISIITAILVGSFRHFSYVWAPLLTLVVAIAWTFSTMIALGFTLTLMDVAVIPLIVGLGVDYSVHISKRYQEGLFEGLSISESIGNSITKVGAALFLAFITTVVAFLSNFVSDVPPIRQFGLMCALGITYAYVLAITFYPSLRILVDKRRGGQSAAPRPSPRMDAAMRRVGNMVEEHPKKIMAVTLILVIGSLYATSFVPVEFNIESFLPSEWESISTSTEIREQFDVGAFSTVFVLVEGNNIANPNFLRSMFTVSDRMEDDSHVVVIEDIRNGNKTYFIDSIANMVEKAVQDNASIAVSFNLDSNGRPLQNCTPEDVHNLFNHLSALESRYDGMKGLSYEEAFRTMVYYNPETQRYTASVMRQQVTSKNDDDNRIITQESMENIRGFEGGEASITGGVIIIQKVIDTLSDSQIQSTIISTIFALVVLAIIYRSLTLGFVSITPVVVAMSLSLGSMWLLDIKLNVLTIMITSLTIGLGVDYSVHVVERFREEEALHPPSKTLHKTLQSTGAALMISAFTTIFGFGVLVIAGIPIFTDFGIVTAVMIAYSLIAAMIVAPVVLMRMSRRKARAMTGQGVQGAAQETPMEEQEYQGVPDENTNEWN